MNATNPSSRYWGAKLASIPVLIGLIVALLGDRVYSFLHAAGLPLAWFGDALWRQLSDAGVSYNYVRIALVLAVLAVGWRLWPYLRNLSRNVASIPMILIVSVVFICGTIWTVAFSFTNAKVLPNGDWAGTAQYTRLFDNDRWNVSIWNLAFYVIAYVIIAFVIGFVLAVFMDQKIRAEGLFRTIYLYPFALSLVITGKVWAWIMSPAFGLEATIRGLGWTSFNFSWLTDRHMVMYAVLIAGLWQGTGLVMALMLAGLRGIDDDIWKAARVDGIPKWRTYIQVVLPMMRAVLVTTFVIVAASAVRIFDLVIALTQGGPGLSSQVPSTYVYQYMFNGNLAQGLAASTMMLLAVTVILIPWLYVEFVKAKTR